MTKAGLSVVWSELHLAAVSMASLHIGRVPECLRGTTVLADTCGCADIIPVAPQLETLPSPIVRQCQDCLALQIHQTWLGLPVSAQDTP